MLIGSFFVAASFNLFLLPNRIASGGVSGISIILNTLTHILPAYTQWALNIPLFIAGILVLGKQFGVKTAIENEVLRLNQLFRDADPDAFVIITNATDVLGEGFRDERHLL
jgi:uncharacterized membrane-anchored protein YitT (DUF2179 family)